MSIGGMVGADRGRVGPERIRAALTHTVARVAILLRVTGLAAFVVSAAVSSRPPSTSAAIAALAGLTVWTPVFVQVTLRRGIRPSVVGVDLAVTVAVCLGMSWLVPSALLPGGVSWVAVLASTTTILIQLVWPVRASVPAGAAVAAAYGIGASSADSPDGGVQHVLTLLLQTVCTAGLMVLIRRAGTAADIALSAQYEADERAVIGQSLRQARRLEDRDLHDTALATLTMVGMGLARTGSDALRQRAGADLRVLQRLSRQQRDAADPTAIDERLRLLAGRIDVEVDLDLHRCHVPAPVAEALADAASEALLNVARHAGTGRATLGLQDSDGAVTVTISDSGCGFDLPMVPDHRFGLRESVIATMEAVAGRAYIDTAIGRGTVVRLQWRRGA